MSSIKPSRAVSTVALRTIERLAADGMTMMLVTHEMAFAREVASRVVFMDGGVIVEQGRPEEIFEFPKEERTQQFLARILGDFVRA